MVFAEDLNNTDLERYKYLIKKVNPDRVLLCESGKDKTRFTIIKDGSFRFYKVYGTGKKKELFPC